MDFSLHFPLKHNGGIMFAIIQTGGKQYRIQKGDVIDVELIDGSAGETIEFKDVLCANDGSKVSVGTPILEKALVKGEVLEIAPGPKVIAYKYKKRKNYHRKVGHRQKYTRVKITEITA
jgi:large subunit ribosomal protein L21